MRKIIIFLFLICNLYSDNIIYYVEKYSKYYNIDSRIVLSLIRVESMGRGKTSHKGAVGEMQVTIQAYNQYYNDISLKTTNTLIGKTYLRIPDKTKKWLLTNRERNIRIGCYYLRWCLERSGGNYILALQYYICGNADKPAWQYLDNILMGVIK